MINDFLLPWGMIAVSLFNTILLFWLGLTVLINAERRSGGVWLAGSGLLLGGAFFAGHTAMLDYNLEALIKGINSWWYLGWTAIIALPCGWYLLMLWYAGYWDNRQSALHRRHRPWLGLALLLALLLTGLLIVANPLRVLVQVAQLALSASDAVRGVLWGSIPLLVLIYPIYLVLCIGLSLDVLRHPNPSGRLMGDLARQRARPWLMATTVMQLLVSLMVATSLVWTIVQALRQDSADIFGAMSVSVDAFDFLVCVLIAVAVVLLGKAIVSYEIFTGKILPRRGFLRQWRYIVLIAAGYGGLVSFSLGFDLRPIYPLLLTTVLMSIFFALFSWRSYAERERSMEHLRPFVASQRLYEHLLTRPHQSEEYAASPEQGPVLDAMAPFRALCADVLGARVAYLAALGPLAPLVGPPLAHPGDAVVPPLPGELTSRFSSPQVMCVPLPAEQYGGALWAVPLWSERGLIGVLLLGEKEDGGLYAQEEIEIARASGERLIDTQASAALAQRLMVLQRRRMAESQVLDRRARRTLHDDVLPRLHTAMLTLSASQTCNDGTSSEALTALADVHRRISDLLHEMPAATAPEVARRGLLGALRQIVEDELGNAFDDVTWHIEPEAAERMETIPSLAAEVLFYAVREAIRNAARYGRGADAGRLLRLRVAVTWRDGLEMIIEDDGVGVGTTTYTEGGSGHGLALHGTMMAVVGGQLAVESTAGKFTRVVLTLPRQAG